MDSLLLKKYGDITYQQRDLDNLYRFIKILNYEVQLYLERKRLVFRVGKKRKSI